MAQELAAGGVHGANFNAMGWCGDGRCGKGAVEDEAGVGVTAVGVTAGNLTKIKQKEFDVHGRHGLIWFTSRATVLPVACVGRGCFAYSGWRGLITFSGHYRALNHEHGASVMDPQIVAGLFTLAGALLGGLITLATVRLERRWERARKDIDDLCRQVSAFYQLEQLYKEEVATLRVNPDGSKPSAKTVMEEMRGRVQELKGQVRPKMTSNAADDIRRQWNGSNG